MAQPETLSKHRKMPPTLPEGLHKVDRSDPKSAFSQKCQLATDRANESERLQELTGIERSDRRPPIAPKAVDLAHRAPGRRAARSLIRSSPETYPSSSAGRQTRSPTPSASATTTRWELGLSHHRDRCPTAGQIALSARAVGDDRSGSAEIILSGERRCRPSSSHSASTTSPTHRSDVEVLEKFK